MCFTESSFDSQVHLDIEEVPEHSSEEDVDDFEPDTTFRHPQQKNLFTATSKQWKQTAGSSSSKIIDKDAGMLYFFLFCMQVSWTMKNLIRSLTKKYLKYSIIITKNEVKSEDVLFKKNFKSCIFFV